MGFIPPELRGYSDYDGDLLFAQKEKK